MSKHVIILLLFTSFCSKNQKEIVKDFSLTLKKIILKKNRSSLEKIKVYPNSETLDDQSISYILEKNTKFYLPSLMSKNNLKIQINKIKKKSINFDVYKITYYNSAILYPDDKGFFDLSEEKLWELWGKEYIMTEVIVKNGNILFFITPFFYETDFY